MVKMIAFDLDGTLLGRDGSVGEKSKQEIEKLRKENVIVVLASGRHLCEILPISQKLNLSNNDYIICCDGQFTCDGLGNVIIERKYLTEEDVDLILENYVIKHAIVVTENKNYIFEKTWHGFLLKKLFYRGKAKVIGRRKLQDLPKIQKIIIESNCNNADIGFVIHTIDDKLMEILPKNNTKYHALQVIMEKERIDDNKVVYYGDSYNDIECFDNIIHSIAVGNAIDIIKQRAWAIISENDEDGVGESLEKMRKGGWKL